MGTASPAAVGALIAALTDGHWTVRRRAAEALGRIGPAASGAAEALRAAAGDQDHDVRVAAKAALARVQPK